MSVELISITPDAEKLIGYCARVSSPQNQGNDASKLLRYCIKHGHWSPFEMAHMVIYIETTRAISAQIIRHRSFSFQEFSQRYSTIAKKPELGDMRLSGATNRQSSLPFDPNDSTLYQQFALGEARESIYKAYKAYQTLIDAGFAPECARNVLPMAAPTSLYMAGSIRSWIHYCQLRCTEDTQAEHRAIAEQIRDILRRELTVVGKAVFGNDSVTV